MGVGMAPDELDVDIRPEKDTDAEAIDDLLRAAFHGGDEEVAIVRAIREHQLADLALVAEYDGEMVGFVMFSAARAAESAYSPAMSGLAPLAVLPAHQGLGVGRKLVWRGLEKLRKRGIQAVVVLGDPKYYRHFGFRPAAASGMRAIYPHPPNAFQVLDLFEAATAGVTGLIEYDFSRYVA
jgi:putative acetyltransferase